MAPPDTPVVGPRIGISKAIEFPWRWHVPAHLHVSGRVGAKKTGGTA
jgi:DNA-3-methyladenine glycosylase